MPLKTSLPTSSSSSSSSASSSSSSQAVDSKKPADEALAEKLQQAREKFFNKKYFAVVKDIRNEVLRKIFCWDEKTNDILLSLDEYIKNARSSVAKAIASGKKLDEKINAVCNEILKTVEIENLDAGNYIKLAAGWKNANYFYEAIVAASMAVALAPTDLRAQYILASAWYDLSKSCYIDSIAKQKKYSEYAKLLLDDLLESNLNDQLLLSKIYVLRAKLYLLNDNEQSAQEDIERAAEASPERAEIILNKFSEAKTEHATRKIQIEKIFYSKLTASLLAKHVKIRAKLSNDQQSVLEQIEQIKKNIQELESLTRNPKDEKTVDSEKNKKKLTELYCAYLVLLAPKSISNAIEFERVKAIVLSTQCTPEQRMREEVQEALFPNLKEVRQLIKLRLGLNLNAVSPNFEKYLPIVDILNKGVVVIERTIEELEPNYPIPGCVTPLDAQSDEDLDKQKEIVSASSPPASSSSSSSSVLGKHSREEWRSSAGAESPNKKPRLSPPPGIGPKQCLSPTPSNTVQTATSETHSETSGNRTAPTPKY